MIFEITYSGEFSNTGWTLDLNKERIGSDWKKEKLIKVITTILESIEE